MNRFFSASLLFLLVTWTGLFSAAAAPAPATAREAIRIVGRDRGPDLLKNILHVFGERGMDQPAVWRVVARDSRGAVREFLVSGGAVISEGVIPPARAYGISGTPIPLARVSVDSKAAFQKAEVIASSAKIGFDSVDYQIRCLELSSNPAWFLTFMNAQGYRVGEISLGASTGTVIRATWFSQPLPPAGPLPATAAADPESSGDSLLDRTRNGLNRGANGLLNGVSNSANWIRRKINPSAQSPAPAR